MMFSPILTKEELSTFPLLQYSEDIVVVDHLNQVEQAVRILRMSNKLGFDTETRPAFTKGHVNKVALLQLSSDEHAFLFRICDIGLPDSLAELLSDASILKIGVAISHDIQILRSITPFNPGGFVDLQNYVKPFGIESNGLSKLSGIVLGYRISKSQQLSNWEATELSEGQQRYAATDAWVALKIYEKLLQE